MPCVYFSSPIGLPDLSLVNGLKRWLGAVIKQRLTREYKRGRLLWWEEVTKPVPALFPPCWLALLPAEHTHTAALPHP